MSDWREAEDLAAEHLEASGLEVLARNVRVGKLEIDILAREGDLAVLVEVRLRGTGAFQSPFASVDARKQEHLRRAGERIWRERFAKNPRYRALRFDVIGVTVRPGEPPELAHVRGAFSATR